MSYKTKDGKTHQSVVVFGENGLPVDTIATISGSYVFVEGVDTLTYGGGTVTLSGLYDLEPIVNAKARYTGKYILLTKDGTIYYIDRQTIDTDNNTFVISLSDKIQSNPASIDTSAGWTIAEADIVNRVATTSAAKIDTVEFRDMHFQMELDGDPVTLLNQDGEGINPATEETQLANNSELIDVNAELDQQTTELQQANVNLTNIDTELEVVNTQLRPVIDTNNQTPPAGITLPAYLGTPYEDSIVIDQPLPAAPADMYLGDWTEVTQFAQISAEERATGTGRGYTFFSLDGVNVYRYTSAPVSDTKGFTTLPKGATHYRVGYQNRDATPNQYTLHTILTYVAQGDLKFPANTPIDDDFMVSLNKSVDVGKDPNLRYVDSRQGGVIDAFTTQTPLGAGESFSSGIIDCEGYTQISTGVYSDQPGTLTGTWYADSAGTIPVRPFTAPYVPDSELEYFSSAKFARYIELTYTNGATPQTEFYISSELDISAKHGQMLGLESFIPSNSLTNVNRTVGVGRSPDDVYINLRAQGLHSGNTSNIPLNANEVYRGEWFPIQDNYIKAITSLSSDVSGTLFLDVTNVNDPTNGVDTDVQGFLSFEYDPTTNPIFRRQSPVQSRFVRHRYVNGPAAQAIFNLEGAFVTSDPGLSSQPLRVLPDTASQAGIVRSIDTIPGLNEGEYVEVPIDSVTGNPTTTVQNVRDDLLLKPLDTASADQITVGTTVTRLDPSPIPNRREVMLTNDGETSASVGFSDSITFDSNSFVMKPGAVRSWSLAPSVELYAIAEDTGGVETTSNRVGSSASGTATNPSNALTSDDVRSIIDANGETIIIDGYTAGTTDPLVSVKLGVEGRKQAGQTETAVIEEIATGSTTGAGTVSTTAPMTGGINQLYVAYVSRNSTSSTITQIQADGSFLTPLIQNVTVGNRRVDVWFGYGDFESGLITASMSTSTNAHIAAYRISNADPDNPIQDSGFTTGSTTTVAGPTLNGTNLGLSLLGISSRSASGTAGAGYTEGSDETNGTGSNIDSLATEYKSLTTTGTESASYTLTSATQWAALGVTIAPAPAVNPLVELSYTLSASAGSTSGIVELDSVNDTEYTVDITSDRAWVDTDIPNVEVTVTGDTIGGANAEIDHAYIELTSTTGSTTRISVVQGGRDLV